MIGFQQVPTTFFLAMRKKERVSDRSKEKTLNVGK
jgi:hypothetical protein